MIGRLRGIVVSTRDGSLCVEVGGVGYEVRMTPKDLSTLPGVGEEIVVHTHMHVREEEMSLYGFASEPDRDLFRILNTASGVGPKVAMGILGSMSSPDIIRAIVSDDADALTIAPGVGKRGAQKLVLELAPKLAGRVVETGSGSDFASVRSALEGLGYSTSEINEVIADVDPGDPLSSQIKTALQSLGKMR